MLERHYALVVDDEPAIRGLTARALEEYHFQCDEAADGEEAAELLGRRNYDLVVTDLRMPRRHGHSLALEVLSKGADRPLLIVLTGVLEPKLAADLIARGIDDIVFKPVDFSAFGGKVNALYQRRLRQLQEGRLQRSRLETVGTSDPSFPSITTERLEERLDALAGSLPVSNAAIEIVNLIHESTPSIDEVSRIICRDPLLIVEVLRLANSAECNRSGKRVDDVQQAVARVGDRQIAELALASTTVRALGETSLAWMNPEQTWRRSLANGLAIKHLRADAELGAEDEGLFLAAMLMPMARVLIALAFAELYPQMLEECRKTGASLASVERRRLPLSPTKTLAGMLARWKLSPRLIKPLQQVSLPCHELAALTDPLRSKVEHLKMADLIGWMALGHFQPWDEIDFPSTQSMLRLRHCNPQQVIDEVTEELKKTADKIGGYENAPSTPFPQVKYFEVVLEPIDLLECLLAAMEVRVVHITRREAIEKEAAVVNCIDGSTERLEAFLGEAIPHSRRLIVSNSPLPIGTDSWGPAVQLPASFASFKHALDFVHREQEQAAAPV
jgi:HD-like signal output (HDOD) protein/FixJ family two-component response regulator